MILECIAVAAAAVGPVAGADLPAAGSGTLHRSEWRASTFTASSQAEAALDVAPDGTIVTVWSSRRQNGGRYGVYAQRFGADGVAVGEETAVGLWSPSHQSAPDVAVDASGRAWVVWQSHGQDGEAGAIIARRFGPSFAGGSEILVNQAWLGEQVRPVVACAADGRALVAWVSAPGPGAATRVCARLLDAVGHPLTGEIVVSGGDSPQRNNTPAVAAHPRGGFAVAWAVADERGVPAGVRLARIDAEGARDAETVDVTDTGAAFPIEPALAATSDGYVVAWLDAAGDGIGYGVAARRLDAQGCPKGEPFALAPPREGTQNGVAIAVAPDDGFVIACNDADADGRGILAQRFGPDGAAAGEPFRINRHTEGRQSLHAPTATRRLVFSSSGALVAAWSGDAGHGDGSSANLTVLSPRPLEPAGAAQGVTASMQPAGLPQAHAESGGRAATPHQPPTFDPARRGRGVREVRVGADPGFTAIFDTGWTPPDPHLAVGPDHVVVMTNGAIAFFTKDGQLTFQDEIEGPQGFWGSVGASGFIFDPEVLYDPASGRFFAMAADDAGSTSWACVAVSDDSDPNGAWHKYRFDTSSLAGGLFDSPNIGVDGEAVYVTGDGFGLGANYPIFIYDKASLLAGDPPAVSNSLTLPTSTQSAGIPPVGFDDPPALYMLEHREGGSETAIRLIALQDPLGSPSIVDFTIPVPVYGPPEDPPQMGTSARPETFDARFWSVAYRNGSLWGTHHVSNPVRARWYEIATNGWPDSGQSPVLVQSGEIVPASGVRTFFTSITADGHGNAAMCFARSSPSEFISMSTAFRYKSDPPGTFQPSVIQKESTSPNTGTRWGDYGEIEVDPVNGITFWAHHEYRENGWRTWVQAVTPPFDPADLNFDGAVGTADLLALLEAWGPCADCDACPADLDGDCAVSTSDLLILLTAWG